MPIIGDMLPIIGDMLAIVDVGDIWEYAGEFGQVLMSETVLWRLRVSQRGLMGAPGGPISPPISFSMA
jgi:hypothetical protein